MQWLTDTAHTTQKGLMNSRNESLTDAESDAAQAELRRLADKDGMGKYMEENDIDMVVSNSDCSLISFAASAGKSRPSTIVDWWKRTKEPNGKQGIQVRQYLWVIRKMEARLDCSCV